MTRLTDTSTQLPATSRPARHPRRYIAALAAVTALSVIVLSLPHLGPDWAHWTTTAAAFITAFAMLFTGELGWERTVASAQSDGLVATAP